MSEPRSAALENTIKSYLLNFQKEYAAYKNKMDGEQRRRRMKEELRDYTNDQRSDEVKKLAIQIWNEMVKADIFFGSPKTYVPIAKTEEITDAVVQNIEPVMGNVAPVGSKKFKSRIREAIADFGSGIKDIMGSPLKGLTLPAQHASYKAKAYKPNANQELIVRLGNRYSQVKDVKTKQSELWGFQLDFSDPNTPVKDKKYIIHFNGNGTFANQTIPTLAAEGQEHECVVINFDYPGVGESTGKSYRAKHMVDAGLAQVQRLLDMGVPAENIMLKGQSIGGGVATLTAAKLHDKGQKVSLYNERSFSKLSDVPAKAIGGPIGKLVGFIIKKAGWEMNAIKAWNKIPAQYKEYCYAKHDEVIPPKVSGLAGAIKKQRAKEKDEAKVSLEKENDKERKLLVGHNDHIYNFDDHGELMRHGARNAKGKPANSHFDNFARKRFISLEMPLNQGQKQQFAKLQDEMNNAHPKSTPRSKVLFGFKNESIKGFEQIQKILKEVNTKGKVSSHQLDVLQHLCNGGQRKDKKPLPENIQGLAKMVKEMKKTIDIEQQVVVESKAKTRNRS